MCQKTNKKDIANTAQEPPSPILTETEREKILVDWNDTATNYPQDKCVHELFEAQVKRTPNATAVIFEDQSLTYAQLNERANQCARYLQKMGIKPDAMVGLCIERSLEMEIALLAILKAGGAYVPLDPAYPQDRLSFMMEDAKLSLIITQSQYKACLNDYDGPVFCTDTDWKSLSKYSRDNLHVTVNLNTLAYVIYTSGSTGKPKGAMIEHGAILNRLLWMQETFPLDNTDRILQKTPFSFDVSVWEFFWPIMIGATIVFAKPDGHKDPGYLISLIENEKISTLHFVPSMLEIFLQHPDIGQCGSLKRVICSGEALSHELQKRFFSKLNIELHNLYGPTEAAVDVSWWRCQRNSSLHIVPIGRPITNTQLYILDKQMNPVPAGVSGELHIGGIQLARGYLNRPDLTRERFIPHPFSNDPKARLYKTGDLCRYLPDGNIEYLERLDHQVKIRGFRIELGEIESVLGQHPSVQLAVVIAREDAHGSQQLVSYIVSNPDLLATPIELRDFLNEKLPEYMVPSAFVMLDKIPLTPNGKIDRKALPAPDQNQHDQPNYITPNTSTEKSLATIWLDILHLKQVGIHSNFFELGGHSLLATKVIYRIQDEFNVEISLNSIFSNPTIAALAKIIDEEIRQGNSSQAKPILRISREKNLKLSYAQQRLWFLNEYEPDSALYNISFRLDLNGPLDIQALEQSLNAIVQRHESLRTTFDVINGDPVQVIHPAEYLAISIQDISPDTQDALEEKACQLARKEAKKTFDLKKGPLFRYQLIRLAEDSHVLLLNMHHIISDGWSIDVLLAELADFYTAETQGESSKLPDLSIQYADYAQWQQNWLQKDVLTTQLSYWYKTLGHDLPVLELPTDHPRPTLQTYQGACQTSTFNKEVTGALKNLCRQEDTTLFMTLLTAFNVLLSRYSGQDDIVIGSPIANRTRKEIEPLIGFFVNTLILRTDLSGNPTVRDLLSRIREIALNAYTHQHVPFEKMVEEFQTGRDLSRSPLFQVMFVLQNAHDRKIELPELEVTCRDIHTDTAKFDLTMILEEDGDELNLSIEYNTDLFEPETIRRMLGHYQILLEGIISNPECPISQLPLLGKAEQKQILVEWNDTATDYPQDKCVHELFEAQVKRTPDAIAVIFEDQSLTYAQLNERANQCAHYLQDIGVKPDAMVGLCIERSLEMMVGMLGILKSGGAYVPLEPDHPQDRLEFMLSDTGCGIVLTQQKHTSKLEAFKGKHLCVDSEWGRISDYPRTNLHVLAKLENLAYTLYTSGSTGRPKGVMIEHGALLNHLLWKQKTFKFDHNDRILQKTPFSFDASVWEFFLPVITGATLVFVKPEGHKDPGHLIEKIIQHDITTVQFVPSMLDLFVQHPNASQCVSLKYVMCLGEALPYDLQQRYFKVLDAELHNFYGPTEATIEVTWCQCTRETDQKTVTIGWPIANTQLYILDPELKVLPVGVPGELHIGGVQLARGYLNRPELTQERFITHSFCNGSEERLYKTGDLCRYLPDGNIEFLNRLDHQVKLRGFRIELGEIETALGHHSSINNVLVLACDDHSGSKYLVAYILPDSKNIPSPEELKSFLKNDLPDYMIPSFFVMMDEFPLTSNGKINRKALPAPEYGRLDNVEYTPPQTTTEKSLATIWSDVLHLEQIGVHDNFFELGGHSLLATRVIYRVQAELHIELSLRSLFENPTIAGLVLQVDQELNEGAGQSLQPIPTVSREGLLPLSFAQQRLWFLNEYEPNSPLYNIPLKLSLSGSLDHAALEQSLNEIISRHESLRTTFDVIDGNPVQVIHSPSDRVLQIEDLSDIPEKEQGQKVHSLARAEADTPFDLKLGPLFRYRLLRLGDNRHILLLNMHHIISDGWSLDVLMNELSVCYTALANGNIPELPPLPVQYVDFANWQQNWLDGENLENQLSYWKNKLGSDVPVLELPTDHPHPTLQTYQGAIEMTTLNKELVTPLRQLSHQEDVTLFMASLAIFKILLSRYSGQDDIVVGSPIANRTRKEIEPLIGFFVNTLVLRTDMPGHLTYRDLLKQVRDTTLDAYANQDIPFEKLVEEFRSDRDLSRTPLFQVMFVLQNTQDRQIKLSGLHVACDEIYNETAKFDLTMTLEDNGDELNLSIEYNTDLFEPATIRRMLGHYQILLAGIIANPECPISQLPLLGEAEQKQILVDWNDTAKDYPQDKCVHELFEAQVKRTPDATAVIFEDQSLTYAQLNEQANQLARHLKKLGVKPDVSVALCMDRSLELLVGLLGILKAGGAYVPLDPAYPSERLAFMLADTAAPVLLTQGYLLNNLPENNAHIICLDTEWKTMEVESPDNLTHQTNPDNLAYIIYTSGSTGQPKGVEIPHRGVVRLVFGTDYITFNASQTFLQLAPVSFDASTFELWGALLHGARCVLYPERVPDLDNLGEALKTYNIDCLWLTASLFNLIIDEKPGILSGISQLLTGGEALSVNHIKKAEALLPATQIINGYGPTESTTFTCCYRIPRQLNNNLASIPIGRAISNTQVYILDPHLNPVPIGVPGELYIGGAGLARGYLHQEELTREKFIDNPHNQGSAPRLYKTGDRCRYLPDGNIEFLGRLDHQVKIRGFRIELGEIESVLEQHPSVQQVVADVKEKIKDHKQLVAYIVSDGDPVSPEALRDYLKEKCPEYMIPSLFIAMKSLPLTPNGKIDRNALPEPTENPSNQPEYLSPLSATEQALAAIWAELLHVKQVGRNDNFFELGGHSLLAVKLFYHIQKNFDKTMPLTVLFKAPTVKQLAEKIRESGASVPTATSVLIKPGDSGSPLFFLPGAGGHAFTFYDLAYRMDLDRPVYGLQLRGLDGKQSPHESMKDMAAYFIKEIQNIQPMGPYYLGGYSLGGRIAFEMAQQLQKQGQKVAWLAMIGSSAPGDLRSSRSAVMRKLLSIKAFLCLNYKDKLRYLLFKYKCERNKLKNKINEAVVRKEATDEYALLKNFKEVKKCALEAWYNYNAEVYHGNMTLFRETEFTSYLEKVYDDPKSGWEKYIAGTLDVHEIHCQHLEMFKTPHIEVLAKKLKASILKAGLTDSVETIPSSSQYQSQCHKTREGSWPVKPETIRLNGDDVHVYCADLTDDSLPLHDYEEMLSADERQRASRYHLETDRTHFIARRAILRKLLGHYLDVEPKDVKIKTTKEGKPILADHNGISSLNFSMASSNGRVVYAFAHDRAIGIDIEYIQPETEHEKLAQKFFAPQEISSLQSLPDDQRSRAFYHCWTMKEAYIKAKGIVPLDQFVVAFPPATPPAILTAQGQTVHADQWTCKTVDVNARWASSLVAKGNRSTIKYWAVQK